VLKLLVERDDDGRYVVSLPDGLMHAVGDTVPDALRDMAATMESYAKIVDDEELGQLRELGVIK